MKNHKQTSKQNLQRIGSVLFLRLAVYHWEKSGLECKASSNAAYSLAPMDCAAYFLRASKTISPRVSSPLVQLGPRQPSINQENTTQDWLIDQSAREIFWIETPLFPNDPGLFHADIKLSSTSIISKWLTKSYLHITRKKIWRLYLDFVGGGDYCEWVLVCTIARNENKRMVRMVALMALHMISFLYCFRFF